MNSAAGMFPGTREPGMLTTFGAPAASMPGTTEPLTMDAITIAEHQREGGGAPSQRRPVRERGGWNGSRRWLQGWVASGRALFGHRVQANHV